jgi:hypothetical protein
VPGGLSPNVVARRGFDEIYEARGDPTATGPLKRRRLAPARPGVHRDRGPASPSSAAFGCATPRPRPPCPVESFSPPSVTSLEASHTVDDGSLLRAMRPVHQFSPPIGGSAPSALLCLSILNPRAMRPPGTATTTAAPDRCHEAGRRRDHAAIRSLVVASAGMGQDERAENKGRVPASHRLTPTSPQHGEEREIQVGHAFAATFADTYLTSGETRGRLNPEGPQC